MQVVLIILSVVLLGTIIRFALSPQSSRLLKLSALVALGLIGLALIICGFIIIRGPDKEEVMVPFAVLQEAAPPQAKGGNAPAILGFFVVFLVLLGLIIFAAQRGNLKKERKPVTSPRVVRKAASSPVLPVNEEVVVNDADKEDEDSFELDIK